MDNSSSLLAGPAEDVVEKMALAQNSGTWLITHFIPGPEKKPREEDVVVRGTLKDLEKVQRQEVKQGV